MSFSVTQVLDYLTEPELLNWMLKNSKAKREKAGDEAKRIGSMVDKMVQEDIKDDGYLVHEGEEAVASCMKAWELFKVDHPWFVPSVVSMQAELRQGDIVGHPDMICEREESWGIVDIKTSRSIYPRYWTQTAKYLDMARHDQRPSKHWIAILRLDKESGLYEFKRTYDQDYIQYEIELFKAYELAFNHNRINREHIRQLLENETLGV